MLLYKLVLFRAFDIEKLQRIYNEKLRNQIKKKYIFTYRLIEETEGTLSCEQIPSANNLSRISHANIVGLSLL